ncbi:hypothetical protein [Halomonas sp. PR-M31]|uniref:hypothetical protein n=1 Tax=Halomonas sp. PR-M31 TaxID=1471202 RepID=UPI0006512D39|nr:hypothetical protein [Halomonas sp. PR-M31]
MRQKLIALDAMHDLQLRMPFEKTLRRRLRHRLLGIEWPLPDRHAYFRSAAKANEAFRMIKLTP